MNTEGTLQAPPAANEVAETVDRDQRAEEIRKVKARLIQRFDRHGAPMGPRKSLANLDMIVKHDPFILRRLKYNGLSEAVEWNGKRLEDEDVTVIQVGVEKTYNLQFNADQMNAVLKQTAKQRTYHPVVRYLNRIRWDGEERIDRYLVDYLGATDTPLHRAMSRRWFVGCVARAMGKGQRPVKVDTVLILAGPQGARKSTSFRKLAGDDWFSDTALDIRNKDSFQTIRGVWIYELAELAATRPRDAETVKAFLSAETDRYRPPYARNPVNSHRQVVFVGTTNEASFLSDPTGARRFHPVTVGKIDLEAIERDRSMLWAEAVAAWKAGERWWLLPKRMRTFGTLRNSSGTKTRGRPPLNSGWKTVRTGSGQRRDSGSLMFWLMSSRWTRTSTGSITRCVWGAFCSP
jgi:predicted P-loop ATPase